MAEIKFYGNLITASDSQGTYIDHSASGIGFFGGDFGLSVPVDSWQDSTFITNSVGTERAEKLINTKFSSTSGTKHNTTNEQDNRTMPNHFAPLNIRFTHEDDAVRVKNCQLRIFDRDDITKNASGVHTYIYEIRHPSSSETTGKALNHRGTRNDHKWNSFLYTAGLDNEVSPLNFTESPGMSGLNGNDTDDVADGPLTGLTGATAEAEGHHSNRHDWYVALSASPTEIGSKTDFGLYFTVEYL